MLLPFVFAALIVAADQLFKWWIVAVLPLGGVSPLIPGVISLTHVRNTGAAFSLLEQHTWLLTAISAVFALLIAVLLAIRYFRHPVAVWSVAAVLGGAIGNLIDRVRYSYVVDMFMTEFMDFAVFNIADIFITCGGLLFCGWLIWDYYREWKKAREAPAPPEEDDHGPED